MIGCNGIGHIHISPRIARQSQRGTDDSRDMLHVMGLVELRILG